MKILIAEDEFTTRMMVQVCLENWGYTVTSVTNGEEAWLKLQNADAPQIAILDWEMPELDGIEVCRRVKEMDLENPPYVILLTGRDSNTDIVRGFDAGADDYMTKPFNDNELQARVRVAERLVRTQTSLASTVYELKEALNQLEMLETEINVCSQCQSVFSPYDGDWHSMEEIINQGADPRFIVSTCPGCQRK
ncbi:response regulator transcription factor [Desulforhopalus sp. IMCC35007]|uniref:response regulator transcription factor n=1 Tax=Desulforhopalus sp. IMCC35007 TaxID=2569543 RepID=UPI0010AEEA8D|nr:response regulator transcription factor [Desulforhopalus sp. IMCC35007]TKB08123.1 response regulator transcription factor [Desulforhopalus sp. IMCC35007]